jgi:hypothetical protein
MKSIRATNRQNTVGYCLATPYNSHDGSVGADGDVHSDGTVSLIQHALIDGDAMGHAVVVSDDARVTGTITEMTKPHDTPLAVELPTGLASLGSIQLSNDQQQTLVGPASYHVSALEVAGGGQLIIDNTAGPVTLYLTGPLTVSGTGLITVTDPTPEKFALYVLEGWEVTLSGQGTFVGVVYAPDSPVALSGSGSLYGAFVGESLSLEGQAHVQYDTALRGEKTSRTSLYTGWGDGLVPLYDASLQ